MGPYSSFRDKYDIYFHGCHNPFLKYQHQNTNMAGYPSFYRRLGGYHRRVAERFYFAGILLAPHTGWRAFRYGLRDRVGQGILGDVWGAKELRTALTGYFKSAKKFNTQSLLVLF